MRTFLWLSAYVLAFLIGAAGFGALLVGPIGLAMTVHWAFVFGALLAAPWGAGMWMLIMWILEQALNA